MDNKTEKNYEEICKELFAALKELRDSIDDKTGAGYILRKTLVKADSVIDGCQDLFKPELSLFRVGFTAEIVVLAKDYEDAEKIASLHISGEKHSWKHSLK